MSLASVAVSRSCLTYFVTLLLVVAGIGAYFSLGQLEDPEFTVKTAAVVTAYPGASPEEVEQEVTERIEIALQEMAEIDYLESFSRAGLSYITVEIKPHYLSSQMPQIFDQIRNKVHDVAAALPPQALPPVVIDDVGQVFGFLFAVVGDEYSFKELNDYADDIKREVGLVEGIARVDLWGKRNEAIYIDVSQEKAYALGIPPEALYTTLAAQNVVVNAGGLEQGVERLRIAMLGAFTTPEEIGELAFHAGVSSGKGGEALVYLKDFAEVRRGYQEPPPTLMRHDGRPAVALAAAVTSGANVVDVGARLQKKLSELSSRLPAGLQIKRIAWQSDLVNEAVRGFMVSLAQAVAIVLVVLWIAMGLNNALIIGAALLLTIFGTFIAMSMIGIDLQRMSLGALVIALGMMVDNAIVVADGATVRLQRGVERVRAAVEAASSTSMPLLAATVIAVSFFYPVYASRESTGEYCASLFLVVAISLILSWLIAMTITPLQCVGMVKGSSSTSDRAVDPYSGAFYRYFRTFLVLAIRHRFATALISVAALFLSVLAFPLVPKMFFPDASRLQFMVDYWAPEGTRIEAVSESLEQMERRYLAEPRVTGVASFIGAGPPRFYLPVEPGKPNSAYAQLIVNVQSLDDLDSLIAETKSWVRESLPEAEVRIRKYTVGPGEEFKFEARIIAPGNGSTEELRAVGARAEQLLIESGLAKEVRTNWRQRVKKAVAEYHQDRGRWTHVVRGDAARALQGAYDGYVVGQYREGDDLIPIVVRAVQRERVALGSLPTLQVTPQRGGEATPLGEVVTLSFDGEESMIWRRDRRRAITVQAEPEGVTLDELREAVVPAFEKLSLPPGYSIEWGGEYEASRDSQNSLIPGMMPVAVLVPLLLVALFNSYRPPLVILMTIPFAAIGVVGALLLAHADFGFMALLGAMSLAGMMIKNAVVLLDQVEVELQEGKTAFDAVVEAGVSRLRPVAMAALTTILGVVPLLQDLFWVSMAVVIMGGLACGTILTMVVTPVFYAILYRVKAGPSQPSKGSTL